MPKNLTVARSCVLGGKVLFIMLKKRHGVVSQNPLICVSFPLCWVLYTFPKKATKPPSERLGGLYGLIKIYAFNTHHQT